MQLLLHLQMCDAAGRAGRALSTSQALVKPVDSSPRQGSGANLSLANLYQPKDLTFHPTLYEISQHEPAQD